jgi:hypothetical protein
MDQLENVLALIKTIEESRTEDIRITQQIKLNEVKTNLKSFVSERIMLAESIVNSRIDEYTYHENLARLDELIKISNKINNLT